MTKMNSTAREIVPGLDTKEPWIVTASGRRLHPFNPAPDEIEIGDIALRPLGG
jgi:hypothetical protein